jgi:drug/metabolite transporter (DMT)-like permease
MLTSGPVDRALILTRVAIAVLMACGFWTWLADTPLPWWLVAVLAVSLALAVAAVLLALDHLPAKDAGDIRSRGRR